LAGKSFLPFYNVALCVKEKKKKKEKKSGSLFFSFLFFFCVSLLFSLLLCFAKLRVLVHSFFGCYEFKRVGMETSLASYTVE
jgi:hypothetical protein